MRTRFLAPGILSALAAAGIGAFAPMARAEDPVTAPPPAAVAPVPAAPPAPPPASIAPASEPAPAVAAPASTPAPAATAPAPAGTPASAGTPTPPNQQVITPDVERRDVKVPHIPSNDFELGTFVGTYDTQNFGASLVGGVRLGYHITEDVFVEAVFGQTRVSDSDFRQILPGGLFPNPKETLRYYDLSAGYNAFPGEIFLGHNHAKVSTLYVVAGIGTTKFDNASHETVNAGFGGRVFLADWAAVQVDLRDHVFTLDLLGSKQTTQNLELSLGLTFFF